MAPLTDRLPDPPISQMPLAPRMILHARAWLPAAMVWRVTLPLVIVRSWPPPLIEKPAVVLIVSEPIVRLPLRLGLPLLNPLPNVTLAEVDGRDCGLQLE